MMSTHSTTNVIQSASETTLGVLTTLAFLSEEFLGGYSNFVRVRSERQFKFRHFFVPDSAGLVESFVFVYVEDVEYRA